MTKKVSNLYFICGVVFATCLIVSNIVEQKLTTIWIVPLTGGLFIFPISYIINDLVAEVWGYRSARLMIWLGFAMNAFAILVFQFAIMLPPTAEFTHQEAFELVLSSTMRISLASFVAFLCGSLLNAYVMSRMKVLQKGKMFSLRAVASTVVGETVDSLLFFNIAFLGQISYRLLIQLMLTQICLKTLYEVVLLPVTVRIVRYVKRYEQTDVYDIDISYRPF